MGYLHCSEMTHPNGRVLTGPATRGVQNRWIGEESTYNPDRLYLFQGDDPRTLRTPSFSPGPVNVYEVEPQGELRTDINVGRWLALSCESALVVPCVCPLVQESDPGA